MIFLKNNAIIIGDSYSTFKGHVPEGYVIYYSESREDSDVKDVSATWWHQVIKEAGLNLVLNNSWSGSTIGYTGYNNTDCSSSSSFIYRFKKLAENGFFDKNEIDTVFIFGGTNDSWSNAPLGEVKYDLVEESDLYSVLPAICYFLHLVRETLPKAKIYCLINTDIKAAITSCLEEASERYGIEPIRFERIDKINSHPTAQGMKDIKNGVLAVLRKGE